MLRKRTTAVMLAIGILGASLSAATAQTTVVPGGLTALPVVKLGPDLLTNGGFEAGSGLPSGWGGGGSWVLDQQTKHSGTFSYRWSTGSPSSDQPILLKKGIYKLSGWVKTQNVGSGIAGIRLQMDFRPGGLNQWYTTDAIQGTNDWKLYEIKNIVVTNDIKAAVRLENYSGATGTAWFDDVKVEEQLPQLVDAFMLYPNYRGILFDDQPQTMRFDVTVTPPNNDFARYTVKATLTDEGSNQVLLTRSYPASANFVAELDGSLMQIGRPYQVALALLDGSTNAAVFTYPAYRVSKAAGTARQSMNIAFDAKNRITVKGTPRFVLGVYDSGLGYSTDPAFWENLLWSSTGERRMGGLRINMYLNYWYGEAGADSMNALMANLQTHGVTYLQTGNCFSGFAAGQQFGINNSDSYVQNIGAQKGSAGYYVIDECQSFLIPGAFDQYKRLRNLDPDSMTFAALLGDPDVMLWRDAADVLSTDPYPMYAAEPAGGYNHKQVADWTALTRDAVKNSRPYLTVLQFFKFTTQGRFPSFQDMRNHAYMAIVEGAKGLFWWSLGSGALQDVCSGWCAEKTAHMNDLKTLVNELADLKPVLIADDTAGALTGNSNSTAIHTKVKVVGGKGYVFASNYTNQSVTATLTWNTAPGTVTVNAENRTLAASGNSFTDTFAPYQAHVYVIGNGGSGGTGGGGTGGGGTGGGGTGGTPTALTASIANPASGATLSGPVTVTMNATGGTAPYSYKLDVDSGNVYTGTNNSFSLNTTSVTNGQHTLKATVSDSSSPVKTATASLPVTVSNGTTSGTLQVAVTAPKNGTAVSGTNWAVMWVSGAAAGSKTYKLSVGGQQVASQASSSAGPVTLAWDTTKVANGTQQLTASVTDAAGKNGTTTVSVNVSNAGGGTGGGGTGGTTTLTAAFTAPAANQTVSGTTTVGMSASGAAAGTTTFTLAVDDVIMSTQNVTGTTASFAWNTKTLGDGVHHLTLTVRDTAGKTATASRAVVVSNTTSTGTLSAIFTSPLKGATVSGGVPVNVWVEKQQGTSNIFTLLVDGRVIGTTTVSNTHGYFYWVTTGLTNGTHTLTARVKDATGNTGESAITVTVKN